VDPKDFHMDKELLGKKDIMPLQDVEEDFLTIPVSNLAIISLLCLQVSIAGSRRGSK